MPIINITSILEDYNKLAKTYNQPTINSFQIANTSQAILLVDRDDKISNKPDNNINLKLDTGKKVMLSWRNTDLNNFNEDELKEILEFLDLHTDPDSKFLSLKNNIVLELAKMKSYS